MSATAGDTTWRHDGVGLGTGLPSRRVTDSITTGLQASPCAASVAYTVAI
ncbi:unannotated protein [freshwater metagenome]|uniref:Unannotated protein n=1 Tax=freshwater metagenome TaxID=449393 RepID=A0A6J7JRC9_9ZZZZ